MFMALGFFFGPVEGNSRVECHTRFAWKSECSPHLAVKKEGRSVTDQELIADLSNLICPDDKAHVTLIETAGGVASPTPSGSLQCDIYRSVRSPAILVGDSSLGGISHTMSAYDSLIMRGFEICAIPMFQHDELDNSEFVELLTRRLVHWQGFQRGIVVPFPKPPAADESEKALRKWFEKSEKSVDYLDAFLWDTSRRRFQRLATMAEIAEKHYWWPFTQHKNYPRDQMTIVDSRQGQFINTFKYLIEEDTGVPTKAYAEIRPMFDACCSWWTQGVDNTDEFNLHSELVRALAFGAGRFGHVIFPEVAHEPATRLTQKLLQTVGAGWASRVFFSDNGSTAVEVAIKMAFGKYKKDNAADLSERDSLYVLGFSGSYHGDTLGAMETSPESIFNRATPWYRCMTKCIDPPSLMFQKGEWKVKIPETWPEDVVRELCGWKVGKWESYASIRHETVEQQNFFDCCEYYVNTFIDECEEEHSVDQGRHMIGACILEPVLQGAGGMVMIEPWFQRTVQQICEQRDIPVIVDEVFTGLWRLGFISGAKMLGIAPDIACYGKLVTGGLVPMGVTLASEDVFDAFEGTKKESALLHGHSYTAYPAGCAVGITALNAFHTPRFNPNLKSIEDDFERQNLPESFPNEPKVHIQECMLQNLWDKGLIDQLSHHPRVEGIVSLGTVTAVTLQAAEGGEVGYGSSLSRSVVMKLRDQGIYTRPLGNVVYLMVAPNSSTWFCDRLLNTLIEVLNE